MYNKWMISREDAIGFLGEALLAQGCSRQDIDASIAEFESKYPSRGNSRRTRGFPEWEKEVEYTGPQEEKPKKMTRKEKNAISPDQTSMVGATKQTA